MEQLISDVLAFGIVFEFQARISPGSFIAMVFGVASAFTLYRILKWKLKK